MLPNVLLAKVIFGAVMVQLFEDDLSTAVL